MANIASIVLADGQGTPVSRTFTYSHRENGVVTWVERSQGVSAGFRKITCGFRPANGRNGGYKVHLRVQDPRLAVTAPASGSGIQPNPVAAYFTVGELVWLLPEATDAQARKDAYAFLKNLAANTDVKNIIENLEAPA